MDGIYLGDANMILPATGLSGTSGNPITIQALNDGAVLIDGQGTHSTIALTNNRWLIIEGLNARNSNCMVININGGSTDNVIRRVVAWDAADTSGCHVVRVSGQRNLLEDVGAFGIGASTYRFGGDSAGTTTSNVCRRCWGRHEGGTGATGNTKETVYAAYPNSINPLFENSIMTWQGMPASHTTSIINFGATTAGAGAVRLYGVIAYLKCGANGPGASVIDNQGGGLQNQIVQDTIAVIENGCWTDRGGISFRGGSPTLIKTATRVSSWGGAAPFISHEWTTTDFHHSSSFPGTNPNPFTGTNGANVCRQYVNGVLTTTPLWPWPMNDRIKAATALTGGTCPTCIGGRTTRTQADVTADVEMLLGPIPPQCRTR